MTDVLMAVALVLATGLGAVDSARSADGAPAPQVLAELSQLGLGKVRVRADGRDYVLRGPRFADDGIGWSRAEGFPRHRPALIAGAGWDSVPPPPNPIAWRAVERIERARSGVGLGTAVGLLGGATVGFLAAGLMLMESDATVDTEALLTISGGIVGGVLGGWLGHHLLDPDERWDAVYVPERR